MAKCILTPLALALIVSACSGSPVSPTADDCAPLLRTPPPIYANGYHDDNYARVVLVSPCPVDPSTINVLTGQPYTGMKPIAIEQRNPWMEFYKHEFRFPNAISSEQVPVPLDAIRLDIRRGRE